MNNIDDALLIEGARSFLDAANAIVHYQEEVHKICRSVMERFRGEYAAALGVGLKNFEIFDFVDPQFDSWEGTRASIGVLIQKKEIIRGISWWEAYCSLEWQIEEPRFSCYVGEFYRPKKLAAALHQKFGGEKRSLWHDGGNDVGVWTGVKPGEAANSEKTLESLWLEWIDCWKQAGGMKMVFSD